MAHPSRALWSEHRLRGGVAVFAALLFSAMAIGPTEESAAVPTSEQLLEKTIFSDTFDREVTNGWGTASSGQVYSTAGKDITSVSGGTGVVDLKPGSWVTNALNSIKVADAKFSSVVSIGKAPMSGNGVTAAFSVRENFNFSYQVRIRFLTGDRVALSISRYDGSTSKETFLGAERVVLRDIGASEKLLVEFAVTGTSPVKLKARVWKLGATAPDWQMEVDDGSAQRIADKGGAKVVNYLSASSSSTTLRIDEVRVASLTSPTPPPTPMSTPSDPGGAGSAPVGSTRYPIPSSAVYVAAKGDSSGAGTLASPYGSAAAAVAAAKPGATLVLRGGTYREFVEVPFKKKLTIQSYPGEAVWFDGSRSVTGWAKSGSRWAVSNWTHIFDNRVAFSTTVDQTNRWVDPAYPMAGYPDQIWIDGKPLKQVASESAVVAGTFFVDRTKKRMVLGSDPVGRSVEASTLQRAIQVHGEDSTVRGIGVRRYATTVNQFGAVTAEVPRATFENMVITDNATTGLFVWAKGHKANKLTLSNNGLMGFGSNKAHDLTISNSRITGNNVQRFKEAPVSGGLKVAHSDGVTVTNNVISKNLTNGLWFDGSTYNAVVVGNTIADNGYTGVEFEISQKATIASNQILRNGHTGVWIYSSGDVEIWNNTIVGNRRTLSIWQDARRQGDSALKTKIPWLARGIIVKNNVLSYGSDSCPLLVSDLQQKLLGAQFGISLNGNLYHRSSSSAPSNLACWAKGAAGHMSFKTLNSFKTGTGNDARSIMREGTAVADPTGILSAAIAPLASRVALPLPSTVAARIGQPTGTQRLGAYFPADD